MITKILLLISCCNIFLFAGALDDFQQASQKKITEAVEKEKNYEERLNNIPLTGQINSLFELKQHINKNFKGDLQVNSIINLGGENIEVPNKINGNGQGGFTNGKINFKYLDNVILEEVTLIGKSGGWDPSSTITNSKLLKRNYIDGGDIKLINCDIGEFGPRIVQAKNEHIVIIGGTIESFFHGSKLHSYIEDAKINLLKVFSTSKNELQLYKCMVNKLITTQKSYGSTIIERSVIESGTIGGTSFVLINSIAKVEDVMTRIELLSSNVWTDKVHLKQIVSLSGSAQLKNSLFYLNTPGSLDIVGSDSSVTQSIYNSKLISPFILNWEGRGFSSSDYKQYTLKEKFNKKDIITWGSRFPNGVIPSSIFFTNLKDYKRKPDFTVDLFGNKRGSTTNIGAIDIITQQDIQSSTATSTNNTQY